MQEADALLPSYCAHRQAVGFLFRDNTFPTGTFLMTGTGIVPGDEFTLKSGDVVKITIDGIGTLANPMA